MASEHVRELPATGGMGGKYAIRACLCCNEEARPKNLQVLFLLFPSDRQWNAEVTRLLTASVQLSDLLDKNFVNSCRIPRIWCNMKAPYVYAFSPLDIAHACEYTAVTSCHYSMMGY